MRHLPADLATLRATSGSVDAQGEAESNAIHSAHRWSYAGVIVICRPRQSC
jgi:hypothetical protein